MKKNVFFVVALIALVAIGMPLFAQNWNFETWGGLLTENENNPFAGRTVARIVCYKQGFVAVGSGGLIARTPMIPAGQHARWEAVRDSTFGNTAIQGIATNDTTLIAVGNNGRIAWSDNAGGWTAVADSKFGTTHVFDAAFGANRVVAVGWEGKAAYSNDNGRTWTATVLDPAGAQIYAVEFGNNRFVAVGQGGIAAWSTDGIRWTKVSTPILGGQTARDITFGGGRFVAVGLNGRMAWSTDGVTWTNVADTAFGTSHIFGITYSEANNNPTDSRMKYKFVAVGAAGKIATSDDGATWRSVVSPFPNNVNIMSVGYGNGIFVAGTDNAFGNVAGASATISGTW